MEMKIRESCLQTGTFIYKPGILVTKQDFHLQSGSLVLQMGFSGYYLPNIQFGRVITANNMIILRELIQYGLGYSFISVNKQIPRNCILCSMPGISSKRIGRCAYIRSHPHVELLRELSGMIFQSIKLLG